MSEYKGVMVYGEVIEGKLSALTTELLGCGRGLADELGEELSAVLIGEGISGVAGEAFAFGADKVYTIDDPALKNYQTDTNLQVMEKAVKEAMPRIILLGQSDSGRSLAPSLAFRLKTAAAMDCVALSIDPDSKRLLATKPVYGGNAQATFAYDTDPQVATVRARVMSPLARDDSRKGDVIAVDAAIDQSTIKTRVLERIKEEVAGIKLEDARVVVSGGRGIGGAGEFKQLAALADILKGAVGGSRPAADGGWIPDTAQVGLTGKMVTPDLYLAIGISGASQHMAGCSNAKTIVAINRDAEANIFKTAHYGIVADWKKALPAFTAKVRELLAG